MSSSAALARRQLAGVVAAGLSALALAGCGGSVPDVQFAAEAEPIAPAEPVVDLTRPSVPDGAQRYEPVDGAFALSIPGTWRAPESELELAEAVWFTDTGASGFDANVNVLVEQLPRALSIDEYLELSVQNGPRLVDNFVAIDARPVLLATGETGGRLEYKGEFEGRLFRFLAIVSLGETQAVIATYTNIEAEYDNAAGLVEPYLLTVASNALVASPDPESPKKKNKKRKKKKKKQRESTEAAK